MPVHNKLRPDRDLEVYFERPSAIAAMSHATENGFEVSGTWRQQFDWAVVEWNRDNVFDHPLLRTLPDGDLSGLQLVYDEVRTNCIPIDSAFYPTVDWPHLRIWATSAGVEQVYKVPLKDHAVPIEGNYVCAKASLTLQGTVTAGDYIGVSWGDEQYNYQVTSEDTLQSCVLALTEIVDSLSPTVEATSTGVQILLTYVGAGQTAATSTVGANANRIGVYGYVSGARTEAWAPETDLFAGGESPTKWRVSLNFADLRDTTNSIVPMSAVRKLRWTYAADQQCGYYQRSEFSVAITNWLVTGTKLGHTVSGNGSLRIEDGHSMVTYSGTWQTGAGNFSGGTIHYSSTPGDAVSFSYTVGAVHQLFLGSRYAFNGATIAVSIDGQPTVTHTLQIPGEDRLCRLPLGEVGAGAHLVTVMHTGSAGQYLYLDFLDVLIPSTELPTFPSETQLALATDWDTDHSIAIPAERTAWFIHQLGFRGRVNHYVGALWFYELEKANHSYASATITFTGMPVFSELTEIRIGYTGQSPELATVYQHQNLIGDTATTIAKAFEFLINRGSTAIWASAAGAVLTIHSKAMGEQGNDLTLSTSPASGPFQATRSGSNFSGGLDGYWRTDLNATPRLNRAARDWTAAFLVSLTNYGIDATLAFSLELQHGDPSPAAGIAQRYPSGNPVILNTPAIQTNFSPQSFAFWSQVYLDAASLMSGCGLTPSLQFGEVQWWYYPYDGSGLPFGDDHTKTQFLNTFGFPIHTIANGEIDPQLFPEEASFLAGMIGTFTNQIITHVRSEYPSTQFEVLYPTDVNEGAFNRAINFPTSSWTPANLNSLKTESFIYTLGRSLDQSFDSIRFSRQCGFPKERRSHLIGIGDPRNAWTKEAEFAAGEGIESVVLFALDQLCLIGYGLPIWPTHAAGKKQG
ncbi:MAG: hypothetical protein JST93_31090 [Acidobacteria bacterium]|nr:hypothetical protein [Acidobacteriota bacterium]